MDKLKIGELEVSWIKGGTFHLDGGTMFGAVPKVLWSKKYPVNDKNQVQLKADPLYFEISGKKILLETGLGSGKLSEKQKKIYGCTEESALESYLHRLNTSPEEIDYILLSHMHFDHASGLTKLLYDEYVSQFPKAVILISQKEWEETKNPTIRSKNTYWNRNWEAVTEQVETFETKREAVPGITTHHTGGHSKGYSVITITSKNEKAVYMGDLMPTHAHFKSLWITAFDDYPMGSIYIKEKLVPKYIEENAWFLFYHDIFYRAVKWNTNGEIVDKVSIND